MKKTIVLFLALVLCLSLCACGGSNNAPETNKDEETPVETAEVVAESVETEPAEPETIELVLGETHTFSMFDLTITGFDYSEKATFPEGGSFSLMPQKGYVTANIYYDVKYTGKTTYYSSYLSPLSIDYNDGYIFGLETFYYFDTGVEAWLNSGDIDPLSPAFSCKACFFVPLEVKDNEEAPLFVKFNLCGEDVIYRVR